MKSCLLRCKRFLSLYAFTIITLGLSSAFANTEMVITSIHDGQSPYLVVVKDDVGGSQRKPGIYYSTLDGKWEVLVAGDVLTGGAYQGILAQLSLSKHDRRYASLAVVDKKLKLFQMNAAHMSQNSIVSFGEEGAELYDVYGNLIRFPEIDSIKDIVVRELAVGGEGQTVLFSIKSQSLIGDGITFAVFVRTGNILSPDKIDISRPIVLDYKFLNYQELENIVDSHNCPRGDKLISKLVLQTTLKKMTNETSKTLFEWSEKVKRLSDNLYNRVSSIDLSNMPLVDIFTGESFVRNLPSSKLYAGRIAVTQMYDVLKGRDELNLVIGDSKETIKGRISIMENRKGSYHVHKSVTDDHYLTFINSELYLMIGEKNHVGQRYLQLQKRSKYLPDDVSVVVRKISRENLNELYVFYSYKRANEEKTKVFLVINSNGSLNLVNRYRIDYNFYELGELNERSNFTKKLAKHGEILFDTYTPKQGSIAAYRQSYVSTLPVLNVTKSIVEKSNIVSFVKSLDKKILSHNAGVYKKYDASKVPGNNHSALFIPGENKQRFQRIHGELLDSSRFNTKNASIFSREVKLVEQKVPARVTVVPMDSSFNGGLSNFKLVTIVSSDSGPAAYNYFEPIALEATINIPFEHLTGCHAFVTDKNGYDQLVLLVLASDGKARNTVTNSNTGLYSLSWRIDRISNDKPKKVFTSKHLKFFSVTNEIVEYSALEQRVKIDADGNVYWISTPEVNHRESKYMMVNLANAAKFYPNSSEGTKVKFLSDPENMKYFVEGFDEEIGFLMRYQYDNKWKIYSKYDAVKFFGYGVDEFKSDEQPILFPTVASTLDEIVESPPRHEIILVSEENYNSFIKSFVSVMIQDKGKKSLFHVSNEGVSIHGIDKTESKQRSLMIAFDAIRNKQSSLKKKGILIGTMDSVLHIGTPSVEGGDDGVLIPRGSDSEFVAPHMMYLLATEGNEVKLEAFKSGQVPDPEISIILIGTPSKLSELKNTQEELNKFGVIDSFHVNKQFLTGSWKVWSPKSINATKEIKGYAEQPFSLLEREVFPNLNIELQELAQHEAKHKVLLLSKELKSLVKKMIMTRWSSEEGKDDFWNYGNPNLELYKFEDKTAQDVIIQNFEAMRGNSEGRRAVLIADIRDVRNSQRPSPASGAAFKISDWALRSSANSSLLNSGESVVKQEFLPHVLYLFETEGRKISPELLTQNKYNKEVSILLFGEREEWESLKKDLALESRFNLAQHFEPFELFSPNRETRVDLLHHAISMPEIRGLEYEFDTKELVKNNSVVASPERKLLEYLVNRSETLAQQPEISQEVTAAFIKVLSEFKRSLIEDTDLRTSKVIDRAYMERFLSRTFGIPLNLNILPPNDPYRILSNPRAALILQELGYRGPLDLKEQVVSTLLAPTRTGNDSARAIPGSIVVFGDSSTGKTLLFKLVVKMLGLKEYQYSNPHDEDVSYMSINVGRITSDKSAASGEVMCLDDILAHINNFLSMPKGFRGHILFDDMHKGDKAVIKGLIKYIQALFDAERGMVRVERMATSTNDKKIIDIPVRNIHLWMTLNPTQDQEKIKRFSKASTPTDMDVVAATLSTDDYNVESSFMMRWGLILNVSKFPLDAKAPALADSLRSNARSLFSVQNKLVLVSPQAVNKVVAQFPHSNAREFLSAAPSKLLQTSADSQDSCFIVMPAESRFSRVRNYSATGRENAAIETYIENSTKPTVLKSTEGKLHLLSIMVDTLRTTVLESFVNALTQDYKYAGSAEKESVVAPLLHGITSNLLAKDYLPLSVFNLDYADFVSHKGERGLFGELIQGKSPSEYFDIVLNGQNKFDANYDFFNQVNIYEEQNGISVVRDYIKEVSKIIKDEYLKLMLRVDSVSNLPMEERWLKSLKDGKSVQESETYLESALINIGKKLVDLFVKFGLAIKDDSLVENQSKNFDEFYHLNTYDLARLFAMIIDRAIIQAPWGDVTKFMAESLDISSKDTDYSQRAGVLNYFFITKVSLLRPATHELLMQIATSNQAYKEWSEDKRKYLETQYNSNCRKAFESQGVSK